jgi:hypothetical protein
MTTETYYNGIEINNIIGDYFYGFTVYSSFDYYRFKKSHPLNKEKLHTDYFDNATAH